ncbi:MAG: SIS domain-containing protein [Steroidobacteraceae bacterium]|jgi:D-sedoheptulose 7-phosphate isomerase
MSELADQVNASVSLELQLQEHLALFRSLSGLAEPTERVAETIVQTLRNGNKLMLCGNGGSAADSLHLAAEFTGRFVKDRKPLAALALSTDSPALTCIANDYTFDEIFSRQVLALGRPGDCLLAISTSGNSRNVIRAVEAARSIGVRTIGLLGREGGLLRGMCDLVIVVPSPTTARIQEAHIFIGHTLCAMVESRLGLG